MAILDIVRDKEQQNDWTCVRYETVFGSGLAVVGFHRNAPSPSTDRPYLAGVYSEHGSGSHTYDLTWVEMMDWSP